MATVQVLVVDDSRSARELICALLQSDPEVQICGQAADGREAVEQVLALKPDIVTMDLQMPAMDGMQAIAEIMALRATPILVLSDRADARNAMLAVERGALEVASKPRIDEGAALVARLKMLARVPVIRHIRCTAAAAVLPAAVPPSPRHASAPAAMVPAAQRMVAIASSTGGPQALAGLLAALPADFPAPILIAQHLSEGFAEAMADWLDQLSPLRVTVAKADEAPQPGGVYLADPALHMTLNAERRIALLAGGERDIYHPSCDRLLSSVALTCGPRAVGIILTGMGRDGARGIADIRRAGGVTIAQDEATSIIFGMNREAIIAGGVQTVLPLAAIPDALRRLASAGQH